ncbi:hypothetical protein [Phyllobacterium sp. YR531]|uniref:hypothetical protein n=1 Tax=Phyllobacterium sp. YR531 TaxID=1144343 RepID=UPI00026F5B5F|nr:hypothetical protein [Phyllobacterium sp. YR531]EJN04483.1 hypothetical protein PMI41_02124 [Phyllobacterium sp. YR531]
MRKSSVVEILARRLGRGAGRIEAIAQRLAEAGMVSRAEGSKRYPPDLDNIEMLTIVLATLADNGLGHVRQSVETFGTLQNEHGQHFSDVLSDLLFGPPADIGHVIIRHDPAGVSAVINGNHTVFGAEAPAKTAAKASIVPGYALVAIAAELQGQPPAQAESMIELARLQRAFR